MSASEKKEPYVKKAMRMDIPKSSYKFVLVAMTAHCSEDFLCWASRETLCRSTSLNRKTVSSAIAWLRENGIIEDTGKRKGVTDSVIVYRLVGVESLPDKMEAGPKTGHLSRPKNDPASSEAGPFSDGSRPVFTHEAGPNLGHRREVGREEGREEGNCTTPPSTSESKANPKVAPLTLDVQALIVDGVSREVAEDFLALRKKKNAPLTRTAWKGIKAEIDKTTMSIDGALTLMAARGWQGLNSTWDGVTQKPKPREMKFVD